MQHYLRISAPTCRSFIAFSSCIELSGSSKKKNESKKCIYTFVDFVLLRLQDVALLDKLIKEDVEMGKLPLLLIANAGTLTHGGSTLQSATLSFQFQSSICFHIAVQP